ncbi:MAG: RNA pyrophosphohydrolase [Holosporales bacterium]
MKHMKQQPLPYRHGVGMMVINDKNQVFVARRLDSSAQAWQMPQGGVDDGESEAQAALRELKEEIGTDRVQILGQSKGYYTYDIPAKMLGRLWAGRYRGQQQRWFLMRFLGEDTDININTDHPEFAEWRWVELGELPELVIWFKRKTYQDLVEEFEEVIDP